MRNTRKPRPLPLRGEAERLVLNAMLRNQKPEAYCSIAIVAWDTWLNVVIVLAFAE